MYDLKPRLFIDGQWREGRNVKAFDVINPGNGEKLDEFPLADEVDLNDAVAAASSAFLTWRLKSPWVRGEILRKVAANIAANKDQLAKIMTLEEGKPVAEAAGELDRTIETFAWCGEQATRTYGRSYPQRAAGMRQMTIKQPIGPVAAFSPWNFPAVLSARKIAPALAAGCTIILKPAEETPGVCVGLFRAMEEAGVPPGVANLVFGTPSEVSSHLLASRAIKKVSLTGSTNVGRELSRLAADGLMNATMELGGHAPVIVFADANPEKAAEMTANFKYRNAGQVCLAPSRIYVHESNLKRFIDRFVELSVALKVGDGMDPGTEMGPLANERRLSAVMRMIENAKSYGGRIVCGGNRLGSRGFYMEPTVITDVSLAADVLTVEPFGPISPIVPFSDFDEVMVRANDSPYGLAAYAFTDSVATATAFTDQIEAGWIGINNFSPFLADASGGGMKESGVGYEGGIEGMDGYLHTKFVSQASLPH